MLRTFPISIYTQSLVHAELPLHIKSKEKKKKNHAKNCWNDATLWVSWTLNVTACQVGRQTEQKRKKGPVRSQYLCLYVSPGPITAPSNRLFTMTRSWGKAWALKSYSIHAAPLDSRRGWGEIKMKHFTEIKNKKRQIILYKKFCTRPSLRCHHLYKFCEEREKVQLSITEKKGQFKIGTKCFKWTDSPS